MSQTKTGKLTEERVRHKLESLGLVVRKPVPDRGVDLEAWLPTDPDRIVRIQVKGRNPRKVTSYRWFQLRVPKAELQVARASGRLRRLLGSTRCPSVISLSWTPLSWMKPGFSRVSRRWILSA